MVLCLRVQFFWAIPVYFAASDSDFFVYLHEKHIKKFGFKFRKTRPNLQVTEKKKTYIYTKRQRNNNIFFTSYTRLFLFK